MTEWTQKNRRIVSNKYEDPYDRLEEASAILWRHLEHLRRNIRALIARSDENIVIRVRREAAMRLRFESIYKAEDDVHSAFSDIVEQLEDSNDRLPQLLLKVRGRWGAAAKLAKDPTQPAMAEIKAEFERWEAKDVRYDNDASFARHMHAKYSALIKNEGSIKNALTRWRKKKKNHPAG